jgi:hypothetical protein
MSTKPFISAEEHLAKLGVTVEQAFDFISANLDKPEFIFATARAHGVTNAMLNEIADVSTDTIRDYFSYANKDNKILDYTSILINFDLGPLEALVNFNNNIGILSNAALSDAVQPLLIEPLVLDFTFVPVYAHIQPNDGVYDAEELGVSHLGAVPATDENIESLFFGTLINLFKSIDRIELDQIKSFENGDPAEFQSLLSSALSDSPVSGEWSDEELASLVIEEAVKTINRYFNLYPDSEVASELVGVLDHSFLGVAVI